MQIYDSPSLDPPCRKSRSYGTLGLCQLVVLVDISGLPRIADPYISNRHRSQVATIIQHFLGKMSFLVLVLVVQHKNRELSLLIPSQLLTCQLDILLQFANGILQSGTCVIHFVDDQDVLADQVGHLERGEVKPLCACDLGAGLLNGVVTGELLVQTQTDGLNGNVGCAGLLEKRSLCPSQSVSNA